MSNELWKEIEKLRVVQDVANTQRADLKPSSPQITHEKSYRSEALNIIQSIFEDLKKNTPDIRSKPQSRVRRGRHGIILEWGNKLELTPEEKILTEKGSYVSSFRSDRDVRDLYDGDSDLYRNNLIGFDGSKIAGGVQTYQRSYPPPGVPPYTEVVRLLASTDGHDPDETFSQTLEEKNAFYLIPAFAKDFVEDPSKYLDIFAKALSNAFRVAVLYFPSTPWDSSKRWDPGGGPGPGGRY